MFIPEKRHSETQAVTTLEKRPKVLPCHRVCVLVDAGVRSSLCLTYRRSTNSQHVIYGAFMRDGDCHHHAQCLLPARRLCGSTGPCVAKLERKHSARIGGSATRHPLQPHAGLGFNFASVVIQLMMCFLVAYIPKLDKNNVRIGKEMKYSFRTVYVVLCSKLELKFWHLYRRRSLSTLFACFFLPQPPCVGSQEPAF